MEECRAQWSLQVEEIEVSRDPRWLEFIEQSAKKERAEQKENYKSAESPSSIQLILISTCI